MSVETLNRNVENLYCVFMSINWPVYVCILVQKVNLVPFKLIFLGFRRVQDGQYVARIHQHDCGTQSSRETQIIRFFFDLMQKTTHSGSHVESFRIDM